MSDLRETFDAFASELAPLCRHISVRTDENGPYIFALGLKDTHTLQLRRVGTLYVLELWHGQTSDVERIVDEPKFSEARAAFDAAKAWLMNDAI
jgi:hypothetical protein